jgi:hypothetical protein
MRKAKLCLVGRACGCGQQLRVGPSPGTGLSGDCERAGLQDAGDVQDGSSSSATGKGVSCRCSKCSATRTTNSSTKSSSNSSRSRGLSVSVAAAASSLTL